MSKIYSNPSFEDLFRTGANTIKQEAMPLDYFSFWLGLTVGVITLYLVSEYERNNKYLTQK